MVSAGAPSPGPSGGPAVGVVVRPQQPPEALREHATTAEEAGVHELWLWEDCFWAGGLTSSALALAWTSRVSVGLGLMPVPLRNAALTAMEVAALARAFPGRFLPGVGHGVLDWMGQVGARQSSPMTLLREHLEALQPLLRGERVDVDGRYVHLDGVQLDHPPLVVPPLLVGARGPKTLALAGERGDGVILDAGPSPEEVAAAVGHTGRGGDGAFRVVVFVPSAVGAGARDRIDAEADGWGNDRPATPLVGEPDEVAALVRAYGDAGATSVVLQPVGDGRDALDVVRLAGAVAGLVASSGSDV